MTPMSTSSGLGSGRPTVAHFLPFQCSASPELVMVPPECKPEVPTAQQLEGTQPTAESSLKSPADPPPGLGVCACDHLLPFQCSASLRMIAESTAVPFA